MISDTDSSEDDNRGAVVPRKTSDSESDSSDSGSGSGSDSDSDSDAPPSKAPPSAPAAPPAPGGPPAAPPMEGGEGAAPPNTETAVVAVEEELPNLEPALSNIQPIPLKKTLMIVNNFVINTTEFVNKFTVLCERKLARVAQKTTNLEIMLALLEVKLGSIDWLNGDGGAAPATQADASGAPPAAPAAPAAPGAPPPPPGAPGAPPPPPPPGAEAAAPAAPAAAAYSGPCLKDDPRYSKFFKMKDMGVPMQALTIKMNAEGVDPSILDMDPLGPPPDGGAAAGGAMVVVHNEDTDSESEESELDAD